MPSVVFIEVPTGVVHMDRVSRSRKGYVELASGLDYLPVRGAPPRQAVVLKAEYVHMVELKALTAVHGDHVDSVLCLRAISQFGDRESVETLP